MLEELRFTVVSWCEADSDLDRVVAMKPAELLELEVPQQKTQQEKQFHDWSCTKGSFVVSSFN